MNRTINILSTSRTALILLLATLLLTMTAQTAGAQDLTISTEEDWNTFVSNVNGGTTYSGQTVTLSADITVTTMAGTSSNRFKGTFVGGGHTLTVNFTATADGCAPFLYIEGASINTLKVAGSISTGYKYAAGIAAHSYGECIIQNCQSSVTITTTVSGDGTHAGFVAVHESGTLTVNNCLFDGSITGSSTTNCGGFVGWRNATLAFNNCLMAGTMGISQTDGSALFNRNGSSTLTNCYYDGSKSYGSIAAQGTSTTTTGETLRAQLGSGWEVSGANAVPIMDAKNLAIASVSGINNYYLYTGNEISIDYTITAADGTSLTKDTHYTGTISPAPVKDKGDYTLTLTGTGNYSGSQTLNFTVCDGIPVTSETTMMSSGTYKVTENVTIGSRITISGDVKLILGEGTTLTASKGIELSSGNKLTIEGDGTLTATSIWEINKSGIGAQNFGTLIINGGNINATGYLGAAGIGTEAGGTNGGTIIINGGVVTAKGGHFSAGIGGCYNIDSGKSAPAGDIIINGGQVNATGMTGSGQNGGGIGIGNGYNCSKDNGSLTLGWTAQTDFIYSENYNINNISFTEGKTFFLDGTSTVATKDNIGWKKIVPPTDEILKNLEFAALTGIEQRYLYTGSTISLGYTLTAGGENLTKGTHFTETLTMGGSSVSEVKEKGNYTLTLTGISPYTGSKSVNFSVISEETFGGYAFTFTVDDEGNYFEVDKKEALTALATYVNSGNNANGLRFKQTADIDMQGVGYTPIGKDDTNTFNGIYDGDGYVILNISHNDNGTGGKSGMFGKITNGTVKNINLKNCSFSGDRAGGIAGDMNQGTIDNCTVIGGTVSTGVNGYAGGILGSFYAGTIKDCFTTTTVSTGGNSAYIGAVAGGSGGSITNCYYTNEPAYKYYTNGTKVSGGFITAGEGIAVGSGVFRTIGKIEANTYYFGKQGEVITFSAEVPTTGMKKFTATAGTLAGISTAGTVSLTMPASDVTVSLADVSLAISDIEAQTYTDSAIEPAVTVKDGETTLTANTDYTVAYSSNTNAGEATVTITGCGVFLGTATKTFTIAKANLNPTLVIQNKTYDGEEITYTIENNPGGGEVTDISWVKETSENTWSSVSDTPKDAGKYRGTAVIAETDNYQGATTYTAEFTITKATPTVTAPTAVANLVYSGSAQALVTAGSTDFGTLLYSLDGSTYSDEIPTATEAGINTVYYKVEGSDNWNAVDAQTVSVTIAPLITITFGDGQWMGYVAQEHDLAVPSGLEAYVISSIGETSATATSIDYLPKGVAVLLKRTDTTVTGYTTTVGTGTAPANNLLKVASTEQQPVAFRDYVLYRDAFVLVSGGELAGGKVFLPVPQAGQSRAATRSIVIDSGGTTSLIGVDSGQLVVDGWYSLDGQRLDGKPVKKGLYIHNGRKEVVK